MLSIVVAVDKNYLIGKDNQIPWHYTEDLKYFKNLTWGKKVVMGSNTYKSILSYLHKPLPNRESIVLTSKPEDYPNVQCFTSVEAFLDVYKDYPEEIFIIGGKKVYEQFINIVKRLYITFINESYEGDTYFPKFNMDDFQLISKKDIDKLSFCILERR
ncbi:MAG TPA: dihydrofolate reductase [Haloplasmataceae bacterium]